MSAFLFHPASIRLGWALVHFLWQGLLLAGLLEGALLFVPRATAALRYALCGAALALMPVCLVATSLCLLSDAKGKAIPPIVQLATSLSEARAGSGALPPAPALAVRDSSPDRRLPPNLNRFMPLVVFVWLSGVTLLAVRKAADFSSCGAYSGEVFQTLLPSCSSRSDVSARKSAFVPTASASGFPPWRQSRWRWAGSSRLSSSPPPSSPA